MAQLGVDVGGQRVLVAADGLRLVGLLGAVEDPPGAHPGDQRLAGLADGRRGARAQPAGSARNDGVLAPTARL